MNRDRRFIMIALTVVLVHSGGIGWLELSSSPLHYKTPQERLVVKTMTLTQPKVERKKSPQPVKMTQAPKKKAPSSKKKEFTKREKLLAMAKENLGQVLNQKRTVKPLDDVGMIESMKVDSLEPVEGEDKGYYGALANTLRHSLRLPEFGEVKIHLTLDRHGRVVEVKIVGTENENNQRYVEKVLPTVQFIPFGKYYRNEKTHTFMITLTNDT